MKYFVSFISCEMSAVFFFTDNMDSLEKRVKTFFSNAKKMKPQDKENEYELIRKDYYKTLEDAGKVIINIGST
jgi:hypothetical protein